MLRELHSFSPLRDLCADNITKLFELIHNQVNDFVVQLHRSDFIDDKMLKHVVGMRCDQNKYGTPKSLNPLLNFSVVMNLLAYAYPLFKTYKLNPEIILDIGVADIPIRLFQSTGNITTSSVTAFLELILNPISKRFCKSQLNEFCQDSKNYLIDLEAWKDRVASQNELREGDCELVYL